MSASSSRTFCMPSAISRAVLMIGSTKVFSSSRQVTALAFGLLDDLACLGQLGPDGVGPLLEQAHPKLVHCSLL